MFDEKNLAEISQAHSHLQITKVNGPAQFAVSRARPAELAQPDSVVFASTSNQLNACLAQRPGLLITGHKITLPDILPSDVAIYKCQSVGLAMAAILPFFDNKKSRFEQSTKIHPSAVIHASAKIDPSAQVGPFCVIGPKTQISENVILGSHCVIEQNAFIGAGTLLHPHVFIGADCSIGISCEIHPHTTVGSDGFGYSQDQKFQHHKLPQLGRVVIGDRVEIGANCAIDRAAFTETRIGNGTKVDNLCHVAHNCEIGDDSVLAAGFFMAGSSKIGKRFMVGGTSAIGDHVTVTDDVILAGRSVIVNDLEEKGAYGGYPIQPMKEYLKTMSTLLHLVRIRKDVARILKHLGLNEDQHN